MCYVSQLSEAIKLSGEHLLWSLIRTQVETAQKLRESFMATVHRKQNEDQEEVKESHVDHAHFYSSLIFSKLGLTLITLKIPHRIFHYVLYKFFRWYCHWITVRHSRKVVSTLTFVIHVVSVSREPFIVLSGGLSYDTVGRRPCLTVMHGKSTAVLEMDYSIVDFLTLCETPYPNGKTRSS